VYGCSGISSHDYYRPKYDDGELETRRLSSGAVFFSSVEGDTLTFKGKGNDSILISVRGMDETRTLFLGPLLPIFPTFPIYAFGKKGGEKKVSFMIESPIISPELDLSDLNVYLKNLDTGEEIIPTNKGIYPSYILYKTTYYPNYLGLSFTMKLPFPSSFELVLPSWIIGMTSKEDTTTSILYEKDSGILYLFGKW